MTQWANGLYIGGQRIALDEPTYFIADIASSHDGDLGRAKELIWLAMEAGADCAKFQHFLAEDIVSAEGFSQLGGQIAHQSAWEKPVFDVYKQYQTPRDWTPHLVEECAQAGITYMTTPYDMAALDLMDAHVPAFKIGSGDITWTQFIEAAAQRHKPVLLSTGASDMDDVERAMAAALAHTPSVCLMQCNTNYTGDLENFAYVNLAVLKTFARRWPGLILGLSDHTSGHSAVLGAVTMGARVVEKHFTDDTTRDGPDHGFSMDPKTWRAMVDATRELEYALGDGVKRLETNERDAAIVQRRAIRLRRDMAAGEVIGAGDVEMLRPCPEGALEPHQLPEIIGAELGVALKQGDALYAEHVWRRDQEGAPRGA